MDSSFLVFVWGHIQLTFSVGFAISGEKIYLVCLFCLKLANSYKGVVRRQVILMISWLRLLIKATLSLSSNHFGYVPWFALPENNSQIVLCGVSCTGHKAKKLFL